jgi:hypothetical protein
MFFVALVTLFALIIFLNVENTLVLLVAILPFHSFLRAFLDFFFKVGDGNLFAVWKETAVIMLICKVFWRNSSMVAKPLLLCLYLFILVTVLYFAFSDDYQDGFAHLRDHVTPILLFITVVSMNTNNKQIKRILNVFMIAGFISAIGGFLQYYVFKTEIGLMMKSIDFIDSKGYVQYNYNSFRIMGFERMSGLLSGPNDFGLYCSLVVSCGVFLLNMRQQLSRLIYFFVLLTTGLSSVCLLLSFSRVGWIITIICLIFMVSKKVIKLKLRTIISFGTIGVLLILLIGVIFPSAFDIIANSITGKEASASTRSSELSEGIGVVFTEPLGHGLGTADIRNSAKSFAVESIFVNTAYEIGILGLGLLVFIHIYIIRLLYRRLTLSPFVVLVIGLAIASLISSFASINTYGMPYIYIWWLMLALALNPNDFVFNDRLVEPSFV